MSVFAAVPLENLARAMAISQLFLAMMNHLKVQDMTLTGKFGEDNAI